MTDSAMTMYPQFQPEPSSQKYHQTGKLSHQTASLMRQLVGLKMRIVQYTVHVAKSVC